MYNTGKNSGSTKKIQTSQISRYRGLIIGVVVLFCCYAAISVYQRSVIIKIDEQINDLETQYKQAVNINDDLQGQILQATKIADVENYAINVLGMIKPANSSISYYSYATNNNTETAKNESTASVQLLGWLNDIFR